MGQPAAKEGDNVTGTCTHKVKIPAPPPPGNLVTSPLPFDFAGKIRGKLSTNVRIQGKFAATKDSTADNTPKHAFASPKPPPPPVAPVAWDSMPPGDTATINKGSGTVKINGKPAARNGDTADTCDELKTPGTVVAVSTVSIGD